MAVLDAIVHARGGLDEHVPDAGQLRDIGLGGRIATQLIGDDLARRRAGAQHSLEDAFGRGFVPPLLQQDVEFGTVLVDGPPEQIRLAAQRHEHLVKMPGAAGLTPSGLGEMGKDRTKFFAPTSDRFVAHRDAALEQEFFDVAQVELEAKTPAYGLADDGRRKPVSTIERLRFHSAILRQQTSPT